MIDKKDIQLFEYYTGKYCDQLVVTAKHIPTGLFVSKKLDHFLMTQFSEELWKEEIVAELEQLVIDNLLNYEI